MTSEQNLIGSLIDLTGRLTSIVHQEIELLRTMRASEIGALQEEKVKLATTYASAFQTVRKMPSLVKDAEPRLREVLRQSTARLKTALDDNILAVHAAKEVNERLIRAISDAVTESRSAAPVYTATGGTAPAATAAGVVSLAIDHHI